MKKKPEKYSKGDVWIIEDFKECDEIIIFFDGKRVEITYDFPERLWRFHILGEAEADTGEGGVFIPNIKTEGIKYTVDFSCYKKEK